MRKFLLCAAAALFVSAVAPAVAQTACGPTSSGVATFQRTVALLCGLTPTAEEAAAYYCPRRFMWTFVVARQYCSEHAG